MVAKTETETTGKLDSLKLLVAIILLLAGIGEFYYFENESLLYRVLGLVGLGLLAMGVVYTTQMGQGIWAFARDSRTELRKVVWPTRQETMQTTLLVVVMVIVMGLLMWLVDNLLRWAVMAVVGGGS